MNLPQEITVTFFSLLNTNFGKLAVLLFFVFLLVSVVSSASLRSLVFAPIKMIKKRLFSILRYYKFHEFDTTSPGNLPGPPTIQEKYSYITRSNNFMQVNSLISFAAIQFSLFNFLLNNTLMWPLFFYVILTIIYYLDSFFVNVISKDFDIDYHKRIVNKWRGRHKESVDVFLPTAGEPIEVLENTWKGVLEMAYNYGDSVTVYCLDDAHRESVKKLATKYGFKYEARPDKGWFKKAGNLRHGFKISNGTFIAIFDADFRPRADFLHELLPYFYENQKVGLVQSPQYFDVHDNQNWLQRGAGAVQELFYRVSQVSRQGHSASICVGSNALYRREALKATGGTALIEHSEDVHTGFNIRMHGWTIQYVPLLLAKGLCPADMKAFFKQQYRWCLGSLSLLSSRKFWGLKISFMSRLSYFSGFLYYVHTAISSFFVPIIPLSLILLYPNQVTVENYLLILPSIIYVQVIYPLWHKATYGIEAWSTRTVYGWAHFFAVIDKLTKNQMQWQATGAKLGKDMKYTSFRVLQIVFNFIPAIIWVFLASEKVFIEQQLIFLPLLISGIYYYLMTSKVTFYMAAPMSFSQKLPNIFSRLKPAAAFVTVSTLLFVILSFIQNPHAAITASANKPAAEPFIIENISKSKPPLHGSYIEVAQEGDTLNNMIQRIMNTYSAETGDLLSLQQRKYVENLIVNSTKLKTPNIGDELSVLRKDMRRFAHQSKTDTVTYANTDNLR